MEAEEVALEPRPNLTGVTTSAHQGLVMSLN